MRLNSDEVTFIIGNDDILQGMQGIPAFVPFDPVVIDYLDNVSRILLTDRETRKFSDVVTFAFWCRKASVLSMKEKFSSDVMRIGRGVAFHIAPSNVAVNFAYSLVVGMLSGNANIVRVPSKDFEQVNLICSALKKALDENIKPYICLLRYGHNKDVTDILSAICDVRIIWGGDDTIRTIRNSPLKPRAIDITFADRYSICVIDADKYLEADNKQDIAAGFYNDTYLTDQNACTSPRIVIWMGEKIAEAQRLFWHMLSELVNKKYILQPIQAVNKYAAFCRQAAMEEDVHLRKLDTNHIYRIKVDRLTCDTMGYRENSGYFMEYYAKSLDEILPVCTSQCQTLSYFGLDKVEICNFIAKNRPRGIDRVVPLGKTMDFSLIWDGYGLLESLTRAIPLT